MADVSETVWGLRGKPEQVSIVLTGRHPGAQGRGFLGQPPRLNPPKPYNPLRIAYHELISIGKDATQSGLSLGERVRYVFGPPGWSHDGSRKTAETVKSEWRAEQRKIKRSARPRPN